jgi:hypothetical protein
MMDGTWLMDGWADGWMDGWMHAWMDGWMDGWLAAHHGPDCPEPHRWTYVKYV